MFRQQYRSLSPANIIEFSVLDRLFPRSVTHCIRQAELSLYEISGTPITQGFGNGAERAISKLRSNLEFTIVDDIFKTGLHQFLDHFQTETNAIGDAIYKTYFDLKPVEA